MLKLFGIPNCDTVRKARKFLQDIDVEFEFIDLRKPAVTTATITSWLPMVSFTELLNKRSVAWRNLSPLEQKDLTQTKVIELLVKNPTLIKRPILVTDNEIIVGFKDGFYDKLS